MWKLCVRIGERSLLVAAFVGAVASATFAQGVYIEDGEEGEAKEVKPSLVPQRSFDRFQFDPVTATGVWGEVGALRSVTEDDWVDGYLTTIFGRLSYGRKQWEAGLQVPYHFADIDVPSAFGGKENFDEDDIGDVTAYGKFVPLQGKMLSVGFGGQISIPTGDEEKFGTEEVELLPFLTGSLDLAVAKATGHVGWNFLTGGDQDPDSLVYGFAVLMPVPMVGDYVAFRNEFSGEMVDVKGKPKVMSYLPGLDIRIPAGGANVLLRPTGLVGITNRSPDWGVGGSIAIAQAPQAGSPLPPPRPAAAVEPAPAPPAPPPPAPVAAKKIVLRGVNFDFDSAEIRPDAVPVLEAAIEALNENPEVSVVCEGHTDSMGTDAYNQALSERRADAVRNFLINGAVAARRLRAVGYGESRPVADNNTEDGRAQNRRVELRIQ